MFQIIGAMAEFERPLIQERVGDGLRDARAKGRSAKGPAPTLTLTGYRRWRLGRCS